MRNFFVVAIFVCLVICCSADLAFIYKLWLGSWNCSGEVEQFNWTPLNACSGGIETICDGSEGYIYNYQLSNCSGTLNEMVPATWPCEPEGASPSSSTAYCGNLPDLSPYSTAETYADSNCNSVLLQGTVYVDPICVLIFDDKSSYYATWSCLHGNLTLETCSDSQCKQNCQTYINLPCYLGTKFYCNTTGFPTTGTTGSTGTTGISTTGVATTGVATTGVVTTTSTVSTTGAQNRTGADFMKVAYGDPLCDAPPIYIEWNPGCGGSAESCTSFQGQSSQNIVCGNLPDLSSYITVITYQHQNCTGDIIKGIAAKDSECNIMFHEDIYSCLSENTVSYSSCYGGSACGEGCQTLKHNGCQSGTFWKCSTTTSNAVSSGISIVLLSILLSIQFFFL